MDYLAVNKASWDKRTQVHVASKFYDVAGFKQGKSSLNPVELEQIGDVSGLSLLHLQCHFGLDSLSWSRLGAKVTGVDLSSEAVNQAQSLNNELNLDATFIESDVYQFGQDNRTEYDIVFTSYGVLCWLPDLNLWAQTIARALKTGGEFHLVETHPFYDVFAGYGYFPQQGADIENEGTYTENCDGEETTIMTWPHSIGELLNALINAGLSIALFNEHKHLPYPCFDGLTEDPGKGYQYLHQGKAIPLLYSIKAVKN